MKVIEVKVRLSPKAVWQLNEIAESEGVVAGQVIERLLKFDRSGPKGRIPKPDSELTRKRIRELNAEGLSDAEIALRIGRVTGHVSRVRRELGLKPGRRRRERVGV